MKFYYKSSHHFFHLIFIFPICLNFFLSALRLHARLWMHIYYIPLSSWNFKFSEYVGFLVVFPPPSWLLMSLFTLFLSPKVWKIYSKFHFLFVSFNKSQFYAKSSNLGTRWKLKLWAIKIVHFHTISTWFHNPEAISKFTEISEYAGKIIQNGSPHGNHDRIVVQSLVDCRVIISHFPEILSKFLTSKEQETS